MHYEGKKKKRKEKEFKNKFTCTSLQLGSRLEKIYSMQPTELHAG